jgi:hypothetical protein
MWQLTKRQIMKRELLRMTKQNVFILIRQLRRPAVKRRFDEYCRRDSKDASLAQSSLRLSGPSGSANYGGQGIGNFFAGLVLRSLVRRREGKVDFKKKKRILCLVMLLKLIY